jgi:hypothetical protein
MRVERVTVGEASLTAVVRFEPGEPLRTSAYPELPSRALVLLPGLAKHRCDNDEGAAFTDELRDTEIAHLLEHVACELMALAGSPRTLRGETEWDAARDGKGVFRVTLAFDDDLVALGALKAAAEVVRGLAADEAAADVAATVERLREVRGKGR